MNHLNEASGWEVWENVMQILLVGILETAIVAFVLVIIVYSLSNR